MATCECFTKAGKRCKKAPVSGSKYCSIHAKCSSAGITVRQSPKSKVKAKAKSKGKAKTTGKAGKAKISVLRATPNAKILEILPEDMLYELLLNSSPGDLKNLCASSKIINAICAKPTFRTNYKLAHPARPNFLKQILTDGTQRKITKINNIYTSGAHKIVLASQTQPTGKHTLIKYHFGNPPTKSWVIRYSVADKYLDFMFFPQGRRPYNTPVIVGGKFVPKLPTTIHNLLKQIGVKYWWGTMSEASVLKDINDSVDELRNL